jgi:hypothetical protein
MNGITILKKNLGAIHFVISKKIEEEVNSPLRENVKRQLKNCYKDYFKKDDVQQQRNYKTLAF